ncbi:MAG: DUF799 family lipoprotein [Syntrophaceae bacterium]|nr:DUF799 family lipoprotein [Syntrophaceae bacterium]
MKINKIYFYFAIIILIMIAGCSSKATKKADVDPEKNLVNIIAVLPVENKTQDDVAPGLLRIRIIDELYFKGYSKLPPDLIDRRLEELNIEDNKEKINNISPRTINELVGADGVLYSTLNKSTKDRGFFYQPITLSLSCELRKSENGEIVWKGQYSATSRNFAFTRKSLDMKYYKAYEEVIEELVTKIMETIPYGPNLRS